MREVRRDHYEVEIIYTNHCMPPFIAAKALEVVE